MVMIKITVHKGGAMNMTITLATRTTTHSHISCHMKDHVTNPIVKTIMGRTTSVEMETSHTDHLHHLKGTLNIATDTPPPTIATGEMRAAEAGQPTSLSEMRMLRPSSSRHTTASRHHVT